MTFRHVKLAGSAIALASSAVVSACLLTAPSRESFEDGPIDAATDVANDANPGLFALWKGTGIPYGIALDNSTVYFTNPYANEVRSVSKSNDGTSSLQLASGLDGPKPLALDGTYVYFGTASVIAKVLPVGGAVTSYTVKSPVESVAIETSGAERIFFGAGTNVNSIAASLAATEIVSAVVTGQDQINAVTVGPETWIYWGCKYGLRGVQRGAQTADAGFVQIGPDSTYNQAFAGIIPLGESVYWAIPGDPGSLYRSVLPDGGAGSASQVATSYLGTGIAIDGASVPNLYWATDSGVAKVSVAPGSKVATVVTGLSGCDYGVAVDESYVYFGCGTDANGVLYRAPK